MERDPRFVSLLFRQNNTWLSGLKGERHCQLFFRRWHVHPFLSHCTVVATFHRSFSLRVETVIPFKYIISSCFLPDKTLLDLLLLFYKYVLREANYRSRKEFRLLRFLLKILVIYLRYDCLHLNALFRSLKIHHLNVIFNF
jgi:hypothetical protein